MDDAKYIAIRDLKRREELSDKFIDLMSMEMGGQVVEVTDESLSPGVGLIKREAPKEVNEIRKPSQPPDGWQTRRNNPREEQSDYITFSLLFPGTIQGFNLDTRGIRASDLPRQVKLEAMVFSQERWVKLLEPTRLDPNGENFFICEEVVSTIYDHVKLTIFRDGGIGRLRIYGTVKRPPVTNLANAPIDLAFVGNGARIAEASHCEIGSAWHVIMPGLGNSVADGWLPPRSQDMDKEEHIMISLARPSIINYLDLHTNFYKGMAPAAIQLFGSMDQNDWVFIGGGLVTHEDLRIETVDTDKLFNHVLLVLYPGGGVMRMHLMGWLTNPSKREKHYMTLAQEERNVMHRVERGVYIDEVDHHHMDINGDMQEETNTMGSRNLYGYIFLANELKAHGIAFSQQALLRLVVDLGQRIELHRLAAALISVTSPEIIACIESYTSSLARDLDYQSPVYISENNLHPLVQKITCEINNEEEARAFLIHILHTLNPNNQTKLNLPEFLDPFLAPNFRIHENIAWFNATMNSIAFQNHPQTASLLSNLTISRPDATISIELNNQF